VREAIGESIEDRIVTFLQMRHDRYQPVGRSRRAGRPARGRGSA
jgi:hypothetical protein